MQELKHVEFNCYLNDTDEWTNTNPQRGLFHKWGEHSQREKEGILRHTIAIVEGKKGQVYRVPAGALKFIKVLGAK